MGLSIRGLHEDIVGEAGGIDLRQSLGLGDVEAIEAGMDRYAVLVFHGQMLSDEQQVAFSRKLGDIDQLDR